VGTSKVIAVWGLIGGAVPVVWGIVGFVSFTARESIWAEIFWYTVMVTCPPWELPENGLSWLETPVLNGILYAAIAFGVLAIRKWSGRHPDGR
jgi:hypothetical protein